MQLLVEAGQIPLSKIMQGLQQTYTLYFNWKYHLVGHLFQGRYKAIVCEGDSYLLELELGLPRGRSNLPGRIFLTGFRGQYAPIDEWLRRSNPRDIKGS